MSKMKKLLIIVLLFAAAWMITGCGQTNNTSNPSGGSSKNIVTGRVVDSPTGTGLKDVSVQITALNMIATSDSDGKFSFTGIAAGNYGFTFLKTGYFTFFPSFKIADSATTSLGDILLDPIGLISGEVIDSNSGMGIHAILRMIRIDGRVVYISPSDNFGRFSLPVVCGSYTVSAEAMNYKPMRAPAIVTVEAGGAAMAADLVLDPYLKLIKRWGGYGSAEGHFIKAEDIKVGGSGNIYVLDQGNGRIQKFDNQGNFVSAWGSVGPGADQFWQNPWAMAIDKNEYIYVPAGEYVYIFQNNGTLIGKWSAKATDESSAALWGIAVDNNLNVYLSDFTNKCVKKFSNGGALLQKWGSGGFGPGQFYWPKGAGYQALAIDSDGNILVPDEGRVQKFDAAGNLLGQWGNYGKDKNQLDVIRNIAVDQTGNIWLVNNTYLQKFSSSGDYLTGWIFVGEDGHSLYTYSGVAVDKDGNIYVTDDTYNRVYKYKE